MSFFIYMHEPTAHGGFLGSHPRQAALKVANKGNGTKDNPETIRLRERGTKKVHIFKGWRELIDAPENKPDWMPEKIWKPNVKKVRAIENGAVKTIYVCTKCLRSNKVKRAV